MSSQRKQIRKETVNLLRRKRIDAVGDNVHGNRSLNPWEQDLPAIHVYPRSEDADEWSQAPRIMKRTFQLVIEIIVGESTEERTSDKMDDICDDVERIMSADDTLDCTVEDLIPLAVEFEFPEGGERPMGAARLIYNCIYLRGAPEDRRDQNVTALEGINANWNVGTANDPDHEAEDIIDLPQS